jgi:predicted DNA-binding transcriptional regulator AlpA
MRNGHVPWSESEIDTLCQLYPDTRVAAIQERLPHRSIQAIRRKAQELMLHVRTNFERETLMIADMVRHHIPVDDIARSMGYSRRTIYRRLNLIAV